jgi:hypothetical protein
LQVVVHPGVWLVNFNDTVLYPFNFGDKKGRNFGNLSAVINFPGDSSYASGIQSNLI